MRKADYILSRCSKYENLISEGQLEHKFMGPEVRVPKSTPKTFIGEHGVTKPQSHRIQFEPSESVKNTPRISFEPEKITKSPTESIKPGETAKSTNLKLDAAGNVVPESIPEEWRNANGELKPEWKEAVSKALKSHRIKSRLETNRSAALQFQLKSPIEKLQHIFAWKNLRPKVIKGLVTATVLSGVYLYITRKKPSATDQAMKMAVDSIDPAVPNAFPEEKNVIADINELVTKLPATKMNPKATAFTTKHLETLKRISTNLTSIGGGLNADNATEMASFTKKLDLLHQDSSSLKSELPKLAKYLQSIGKNDEAKKINDVLYSIDSYIDLIEISKITSNQSSMQSDFSEKA